MSAYVTVPDLKAVIQHMLDERLDELRLLRGGDIAERALREHHSALEALPPSQQDRSALSQELREADRHHDGAVQALWHHLQGYLADPKTPPALAQDATDLLARLLPHGRSIAGKSYLDEAHNAQRLAPEVEAARAKLETFPIASTAGAPGTLYEVALRVVQAGLQLDALLKQRAAHQAAQTTTHEPAQHLAARSQAQGYLGRLREVVREEAKYRPELPPNLEGRLFAYLDLVASTRQPTP